jgi:hypothetical protein
VGGDEETWISYEGESTLIQQSQLAEASNFTSSHQMTCACSEMQVQGRQPASSARNRGEPCCWPVRSDSQQVGDRLDRIGASYTVAAAGAEAIVTFHNLGSVVNLKSEIRLVNVEYPASYWRKAHLDLAQVIWMGGREGREGPRRPLRPRARLRVDDVRAIFRFL